MDLYDNILLIAAGALFSLLSALIIGLVKKADSMVTALNKMQESLASWTEVIKLTSHEVKDHSHRLAVVEGKMQYFEGRGNYTRRFNDLVEKE